MDIKLSQILPITNTQDYKLHLACWNGKDDQLDVFVKDRDAWEGWNTWRAVKDDFNRKYIFSLIQFHVESTDVWLFGGIYKILSRGSKKNAASYKIELCDDTRNLVGRLKVYLKRPSRSKAFKLDNYYDDIVALEILREGYTGEAFCGYERINHDFYILETIFKTNRPDWKGALENVKGVYLITDKSNGKRYVGSAYGDSGIWSRWECYIGTGHGWNDELTKLIEKEGIGYARKYFQFTLLEYRSVKVDDNVIIERENYWKEVLLTRGERGYNKN
jgi:hypothetical protein